MGSGALLLFQAGAHAGAHRAALVIEHGATWPGAHVLFRCVQFAQDAISGLALLELAGANSGEPPQVYDWGGGAQTICQVDREPSTVPARCFGPTSGPNWSDWALTPNGWSQRSSGAAGYSVRDGDVEGWTYTSGFGAPPPAVRFTQVCPPPATAAATAATVPRPSVLNAQAPRLQATPSLRTTTDPTATASLEAVAPTVSPTPRIALAETGPQTPSRPAIPVLPLALIGLSALSLLGLGLINFRRRAP